MKKENNLGSVVFFILNQKNSENTYIDDSCFISGKGTIIGYNSMSDMYTIKVRIQNSSFAVYVKSENIYNLKNDKQKYIDSFKAITKSLS